MSQQNQAVVFGVLEGFGVFVTGQPGGKGAAVYIAADITVAKNFKETLQRAIFARRTMQDREDNIGAKASW